MRRRSRGTGSIRNCCIWALRRLPGGTRDITLTRRHHDAEVEVTSQSLDEPGLRRLLSTLHPLSNTELERLMREKVITQGY
ncbi:hypothetical protein [Streptomyces sp. NBC_00154]|uniref:hypothetical protein n=1 Tax=Streptomyces sp. NBC_00154 TaxID=2975670 RepID=UPI00224C7E3B|nr:hypothetical protein [Streptomyces sp. NBC_00154]MCX5315886.1 hypothetical protein [Streptomyces sp. NBC_00154]